MSTPADNLSVPAADSAPSPDSTPASAPATEAPSRESFNNMFGFSEGDLSSLDESGQPPVAEPEPDTAPLTEPEATPPVEPPPGTGVPAEPTPEAEPQPVATAPDLPTDVIAPVFAPFNTPEEGVNNAEQFIKNLSAYDAGVARSLLNAAYDVHKPFYTQWALQDLGINPKLIPALTEKAGAINDWLTRGGELPATPGEAQFPGPDQFNVVTMPDGRVYELDNPDQKEAYESRKALFERDQADARAKSEAETRDAQAAQQAELAAQDKAANDFTQARISKFTSTFENMKVDYGDRPEVPGFKELSTLAPKAIAQALMMADPKLRALDAEGDRLSREGGTRASVIAQQMDDAIQGHINTAKAFIDALIVNANRVETAARTTDPVLPAGVKRIAAGATPNPTPQQQGPQSMDNVIKNIGAEIEAQLGGRV